LLTCSCLFATVGSAEHGGQQFEQFRSSSLSLPAGGWLCSWNMSVMLVKQGHGVSLKTFFISENIHVRAFELHDWSPMSLAFCYMFSSFHLILFKSNIKKRKGKVVLSLCMP
jgi:hypothetical protein